MEDAHERSSILGLRVRSKYKLCPVLGSWQPFQQKSLQGD